jgi:hypothetical protein
MPEGSGLSIAHRPLQAVKAMHLFVVVRDEWASNRDAPNDTSGETNEATALRLYLREQGIENPSVQVGQDIGS